MKAEGFFIFWGGRQGGADELRCTVIVQTSESMRWGAQFCCYMVVITEYQWQKSVNSHIREADGAEIRSVHRAVRRCRLVNRTRVRRVNFYSLHSVLKSARPLLPWTRSKILKPQAKADRALFKNCRGPYVFRPFLHFSGSAATQRRSCPCINGQV